MSTEKDREAAIKHLDIRYPAKDFANPYNYNMVVREHVTSFLAGIQHARQGERERLERLFWFARSFEVHALHGKTSDLIDEFLAQEAKRDE